MGVASTFLVSFLAAHTLFLSMGERSTKVTYKEHMFLPSSENIEPRRSLSFRGGGGSGPETRHQQEDTGNGTNAALVRFLFSCEDSAYPGLMTSCDMVSWRSARVTREFLDPNTMELLDSKSLDFGETQNVAASMASDEMVDTLGWLKWDPSAGKKCEDARRRVACGYMFRRCRYGKPDMVPENMCYAVASEYRSACLDETSATTNKTSVPILNNVFPNDGPAIREDWNCVNNSVLLETNDCKSFQQDDECVFVPHVGYFLLDIELGPFKPLVDIYAALLTAWCVLFVAWLVIVFIAPLSASTIVEDSNPLLRMLTVIPFVKCAYVGVSFAFWSTCVSWGECSYWLNVGQSNLMLIFETCLFLCLILIGKGWNISRSTISQFELRRTVLIVCLFYLGDSLLLVIKSYVKWFYWILLALVYIGMTAFIVKSATKILSTYRSALLQLEIGADTFNGVFVKLLFFLRFRFVVVIFAVGAIIAHGLLASIRNAAIWPYYVFFEVVEILLFLSLFVLLWPHREHSLFSQIGATALFNEDEFHRLAPMLTADVTTTDNDDDVDDVDRMKKQIATSKNDDDDVIDDGLISKRSNSATSLMSTDPMRVSPRRHVSGTKIRKSSSRRRGRFSWRRRQSSKSKRVQRSCALAPVIVIRHPGDEERIAIGVKSNFSSVFMSGLRTTVANQEGE